MNGETIRTSAQQKEEAEQLLDSVLPLAKKLLLELGEFCPYGEILKTDGAFVSVSADSKKQNPTSTELISTLRKHYREKSKKGVLLACAVVYDVRIRAPSETKKKDAIAVVIDHRDGLSVEIFYPYTLSDSRELIVKPAFAQKGSGQIFS